MKQRVIKIAICLVLCLIIPAGAQAADDRLSGTSEPIATATPKPTGTPAPTATPKPTESPVPTEKPAIDYEAILSMSQTAANMAVGQKMQLFIQGLQNVPDYVGRWYSENSSIADVNPLGEVTAFSMSTDAGVNIYYEVVIDGEMYRFVCTVYVSQPSILENWTFIQSGKTKQIHIAGLLAQSTVSYESSDPGIAFVNEAGVITALTSGECTITITADGLTLSYYVTVTSAKLNCTWFLSYAGKTKQLRVTGESGKTGITYRSANPKIATVSSSGKIKAKKRGNTKIIVRVDGIELTCVVNITYKKAWNVIQKGKKKLGYKYSQARRMSAKYFDCSSFVWRMFKTQKIYFGSRRRAPVAAGEAKMMVLKKKVVAYKYVNPSKLLAGDIIFVKGKYNGRYRNICHVAIYIGNGKILHSTPPCVKYGDYDMYRSRITLIARPCK